MTKTNQDTAYSDGCGTKTDSYGLQRAKSPPLASAHQIDGCDAKEDERPERNNDNAKLSFCDHGPHIIAQGHKGATLERSVRIEK